MSEFFPYTEAEHIAHINNDDGVVLITNCERCWDEIYQALGEEATLKLADAVPDALAKVNASLMREDAQLFQRVRALGGSEVKVWHRLFSGDFMAKAYVTKPGRKVKRPVTAIGDGLNDALENLATAVADALYPVLAHSSQDGESKEG